MRFNSKIDIYNFLSEVDRIDLISSIDEDYNPSSDLLELLLTRRRNIIPGLKNFRKSQKAKENWRKNKFKILKGINIFHKSTAGKRFHRELGRLIATRDFFGKRGIFSTSESTELDIFNLLKAISSMKTHLIIQFENYMTIDDYIEYEIFYEELYPALYRIENSILEGNFDYNKEDLDIFLASLNSGYWIGELTSNKENLEYSTIEAKYNSIIESTTSYYPHYFALTEIFKNL